MLDPSLLCIVSLCRSPISKIRAKFHCAKSRFFFVLFIRYIFFYFYSTVRILFHRSTKCARIKNSIQCFAHSQNRYYVRYCLVHSTKKQISLNLSSVTFKLLDSRIYFQGIAAVGINKLNQRWSQMPTYWHLVLPHVDLLYHILIPLFLIKSFCRVVPIIGLKRNTFRYECSRTFGSACDKSISTLEVIGNWITYFYWRMFTQNCYFTSYKEISVGVSILKQNLQQRLRGPLAFGHLSHLIWLPPTKMITTWSTCGLCVFKYRIFENELNRIINRSTTTT